MLHAVQRICSGPPKKHQRKEKECSTHKDTSVKIPKNFVETQDVMPRIVMQHQDGMQTLHFNQTGHAIMY
jgi:hypothetical protein